MDGDIDFEAIPQRYPELRGKVAIVTGSGRGIGKGIAARLGREGMKVVVNGRTKQEVGATAAQLRGWGVTVLEVVGDISKVKDIALLFRRTLDSFGGVDLLVNNAALMKSMPFTDLEAERFDSAIATNLRGPLLCSQHAIRSMRERGGGSIVHISSVGGLRVHQPGTPYDVTKSALDGLTRAMGVELADQGIRVNAIAPGAISTELRPAANHPDVIAQENRIPARRMGTTLEIGATVAFLASPDAAYINGQVLYVDGGITAQLYPRGQFI